MALCAPSVKSWARRGGWSIGGDRQQGEKVDSDLVLVCPESLEGRRRGP